MKNEDVSKVLNDVQDMKGRQDEMTMKLDQIKRWATFQLYTVQVLCYAFFCISNDLVILSICLLAVVPFPGSLEALCFIHVKWLIMIL